MSDSVRPIVLVTGAGGFIGSAVVRLLSASGCDVRAGLRRGSPGGVPCDLDKSAEVAAAVRGADLVVHAAYGDSTRLESQCQTLLTAMATEGVRTLIHFSSIAVFGDTTGTISEATTPLTAIDAYSAGKIACEAQVRRFAEEHGSARRALILRPGIVYGAGSPFWIEKLGDRIRRGVWGTFGTSGEGSAALVHVDDVARAVQLAVVALTGPGRASLPAQAALTLVGPDTPSWNAYFTALAAAMGEKPLREIGAASLKRQQTVAMAAKIWRKIGLPGGEAAALAATPGEIALFSRQARYDTSAATRLIGFSAGIGLDEGLKRSVSQVKS